MKKFILLTLCCLSHTLFGQNEFNKWSVGGAIGGHDGLYPSENYHTKAYQIHHYGINGRYMVNNRFGFMLDVGYDFIDGIGSGDTNVNYMRVSLQTVINVGDILNFQTFSDRIGMLMHAGGGYSTMWCPMLSNPAPTDPMIKNSDDMINLMVGLTPQFKMNEHFSLNVDVSYLVHHRQDYNFDFSPNKQNTLEGYFFNWSVGASYYFGKNEKHADWVPTEYCGGGKNARS